MYRSIDVAPRNSLVLVMDRSAGVIPETLGEGLVAATSSCIAVGTRQEHDGETSISISHGDAPYGVAEALVFDGLIETPSKVLSICSVLGDVLLELPVAAQKTRVQVWVNDATRAARRVDTGGRDSCASIAHRCECRAALHRSWRSAQSSPGRTRTSSGGEAVGGVSLHPDQRHALRSSEARSDRRQVASHSGRDRRTLALPGCRINPLGHESSRDIKACAPKAPGVGFIREVWSAQP